MRFVDIKLKCGWTGCTTVAPEGEGLVITRTLTVDQGKPREIDICKEHSDQLDELHRPLLEDGRVAETAKRKSPSPKKTAAPTVAPTVAPTAAGTGAVATDVSAEDLTCKVDTCGRGPFKNGAGLAQHVTQKHNYPNLDAYRVHYPLTT